MVSPRDLIPTMHYDARTVLDAAGALNRFDGLSCEVLLLGGSRSARNLTAALDELSAELPRAHRVTLPGSGHTAAYNSGKPELVAAQLRAGVWTCAWPGVSCYLASLHKPRWSRSLIRLRLRF